LNFSFYMGFHGLVASDSVVRLVCGAPRRLRLLLPSVLSLLVRREDPRLVVGPDKCEWACTIHVAAWMICARGWTSKVFTRGLSVR